ncbi:hypothetical protein [Gimesia sp.]|nr:hypothetical protein [Gimesia sp.]
MSFPRRLLRLCLIRTANRIIPEIFVVSSKKMKFQLGQNDY